MMASEIITSNPANEIRENLVQTAIKFLTNPNVQRCTNESKERFLRSKGLTDPEIQKALHACAEMMDLKSIAADSSVFPSVFFNAKRNWLRDQVVPLLVYGGLAYGCYWFYKNCIRHLLFVEPPKRKSTAECIDELRKSLDILNSGITQLRNDVQGAQQQAALKSQLDTIKGDITSIKGILLNRNQFPSLKSRTEPPSIPAWQRQAEEASTEAVEEKKKHRRSQRSESGGSNSSEGEQATKNSDSSLEIIT